MVLRVEVIRGCREDVDTLFTLRELLARLEVLMRLLRDEALLVGALATTLGRDAVRDAPLVARGVDLRSEVLALRVVLDVPRAAELVTTRGRDAVRVLPLVETTREVRDPVSRGAVTLGRVRVPFPVADDVLAVLELVVDRVLASVRVSDTRSVLNVDRPTFRTSVRSDDREVVRAGRWMRSRFRSMSAFGSVRVPTDAVRVEELRRAVAVREVADATCCGLRP